MESSELESAVTSLVDEYRSRCLWFLKVDYYPSSPEDIRRVLGWIRRYGDVAAFRRASEIEQWLSRFFSETSAVS
jgi:hypothetical protein